MKNLKFMDLFLHNIISKGFSLSLVSGLFRGNYLKRFNYNSIVILVFMIFLII